MGKGHVNRTDYPDDVANYKGVDVDRLTDWLRINSHTAMAGAIERCEKVGVPLECECDHRGSFPISCHRSMCPTCSEKGSRSHKRKIARIAKRLKWVSQVANYVLGYCVFTVPKRLRHYFMDKGMLSELHRLGWECVRDVLGAEGSATVVHFYGDEWYTVKGLAQRLNKPEFVIRKWVEEDQIDSRKDDQGRIWVRNPTWLEWHPHINVLFPMCGSGHVPERKLKELRQRWRELLQELLGVAIDENEENAYYCYAKAEAQVMHKIGYVSRSTVGADRFLGLLNAKMTSEMTLQVEGLKGWRNVRYHGRLSDRNWKKYLQELEVEIEEKKGIECPVCHEQGCDGHQMKVTKINHKVKRIEKEGSKDLILSQRVNLDELGQGDDLGRRWFAVKGCDVLLDRDSFIQLRLAQGKSIGEVESEMKKTLEARGSPGEKVR